MVELSNLLCLTELANVCITERHHSNAEMVPTGCGAICTSSWHPSTSVNGLRCIYISINSVFADSSLVHMHHNDADVLPAGRGAYAHHGGAHFHHHHLRSTHCQAVAHVLNQRFAPLHAGITAMLTCFPLDVVRTRIMAAPVGSMPPPLRLLRDIGRAEGAGALYAGVLPALISVAPSGAVFYGTYDLLKVGLHMETESCDAGCG